MLPDTFTLNGQSYARTDLDELVRIVQRDARGTPAEQVPAYLRVLGGPAQDLSGVPDPSDWVRHRDGDVAEQYLFVIDRNVTDVTSDDPARMLMAIASLVQDYVVADGGKPWPEIVINSRRAVLDAIAVGPDQVWWCDRGHPVCAVGEFHAA